jgi:hypothetical protein
VETWRAHTGRKIVIDLVLPPEPPIDFASPRIASEWRDGRLDHKTRLALLHAALFAQQMLGWRFLLTCIFRTQEEDQALGGSGIHPVWRAVDVRTRDRDTKDVALLAAYINGLWVYDPTRPRLVVCYTAEHGTGPHAHVQTHPYSYPRIPDRAA